jgi:hypothetical protein
MFDGDPNAAGRRAARMKKEEAGQQYTDKVGAGSAQSARRAPAAEAQELGGKPGAAPATLFSHRINAKRHSFDIEISCLMPLLDMSVNAGRRQISFHCEQDSHTITVPEGFDVEKANITSDEFEQGRVGVAVPMVQRSVFG